jgi:hypothetical protein
MDPAGGVAPCSTPWKPWPARSGAEVVFLPGERQAAKRIARRLFQCPLENWQYAGLTGAPDDATVEVGTLNGQLYIEMGDPIAAAYRAYYCVRREASQPVLINDGFHIHARGLQRRGFGSHVFLRQAMNAAALGIARIELVAGRRADENGYYTWPRLGFDGVLPDALREQLPIGVEDARTVLDVMESEKGRAWWRECGATIPVAFDLADGSRSRAVLARYVAAKMNFAGGQKLVLKSARRWRMLSLDDDARHNTRQREESGAASVDHG